MRLIAIDSQVNPSIGDILHMLMFHGEATRADVEFPNSPSHYLGDDKSYPLQVSISGVGMSEIFKPCNSVVVSARLQGQFGLLANVEFGKVEFKKLVNFPYAKGDFSYYQSSRFLSDPSSARSDMLLNTLDDDPALHANIVSYYELILANAYRLTSQAFDRSTTSYRMRSALDDERTFPWTAFMLDHYPIVWSKSIVFSRVAFDIVEPSIDWDFFDAAEFSV